MNNNPPLPHTLLIAGSNPRNLELLGLYLGQAGYATLPVADLAAFDAFLAGDLAAGDPEAGKPPVGLALVDISGFDANIWERCARLHQLDIPLLIISPRQSVEIQQKGLARGARGVLVKPLVIKELLLLVKGMIEDA